MINSTLEFFPAAGSRQISLAAAELEGVNMVKVRLKSCAQGTATRVAPANDDSAARQRGMESFRAGLARVVSNFVQFVPPPPPSFVASLSPSPYPAQSPSTLML